MNLIKNTYFNVDHKSYYYDFEFDLDIARKNNCWCMIVIGGRKTGKTYNSLEYMRKNKIMFSFTKRTNDDVKIMCGKKDLDLSPFKPINRDKGCNIQPYLISKGIGGFYNEVDPEEDEAAHVNIGYIVSMNAIGSLRGFDMSDSDFLIFDEFIPPTYERMINKNEGDQFLDLYATIARDREHRGKSPLMTVLLANANRAYNPIIETMELTDVIVNMKDNGYSYYCDNGFLIHLLDDNPEFKDVESNTAIMKSLGHTSWGHMALDNEFAYDDFSCIGKTSIKGYSCIVGFKIKETVFYVWQKNNQYYICHSKAKVDIYDLNKETVAEGFYYDYALDLRNYTINQQVLFESFRSYNAIMNYKKLFM